MDKTKQVLHIILMGQFRLRYGETAEITFDTPSHQALLAYLVFHAGQTQKRQHLAFLFWPTSAEGQARTNLRKALYHLRQALPHAAEFLRINRHTVTWCAEAPFTLDIADFQAAFSQAQQATSPTDRRRALALALDKYHGELLPGHYDGWILAQRELVQQKYVSCLTQYIQVLEEAHEYASAAAAAQQLLQVDPLHEAAYRRFMRLQALSGNRAGALRTYHTCDTILQRELGVAPSAATQNAYRQLLALKSNVVNVTPARLPLVGREAELSTLHTAWRHGSRKQPQLALIRGEAGIGKTRLAEELLDWAARQGVPTPRANCYAAGGSLPYAPIADWLRAAISTRRLNELEDRWVQEVSRVVPEIISERANLSPPGPITESWQRQHLFTALAHAMLQQSQPFILFIDDLQWCDIDTLEWLCFLLHFDARSRFLVLGTVRTEEISGGHPLITLCQDLQHDGRIIEVDLERLSASATAVLGGHATGRPLDPPHAAQLFAETEGVPLFIVEMARAGFQFSEENDLFGPHHNPSTEIELPPKVHAVIEGRLANLSPTAGELTALAATIGRTFTFELLAAASEERETTLVRALDELWQQRIVQEQGIEGYDFTHDKLRQVAYVSLSPARRRLLHGQIINALEAQRAAGQEIDESQLGDHYVAIGQVQAAIASYRRAAKAAAHIYAHQEALVNLNAALMLAEKIDAEGSLLSSLRHEQEAVRAMI